MRGINLISALAGVATLASADGLSSVNPINHEQCMNVDAAYYVSDDEDCN